jgi:hypothetical protein
MARFYFHVSQGRETFRDTDGFDCADLAAAHRYAVQLIYRIMMYDPEERDWRGWRVDVTDVNDHRALVVLSPSGDWTPRGTFGRRKVSPVRLKLVVSVALVAVVMSFETAASQTLSAILSCVQTTSSLVCVRAEGAGSIAAIRSVPPSDETKERRARQGRWIERCRPVVIYDNYGVGRYRYATQGCEFGKYTD